MQILPITRRSAENYRNVQQTNLREICSEGPSSAHNQTSHFIQISICWLGLLHVYLLRLGRELALFSATLSTDIHLASEHGRHLRSSSYRSLTVPRTRTTFGDRSFTVARPRLWNSLPATLRQINSYGQFRRHLKTHLFRA